jgi:DNA gyrase/topoisomerase IV subunit A
MPEDTIAAFDVVEPECELLIVSELGYGKRSPMSEFPVHGRNSQGVWAMDHHRLDETGKVAAARVVHVDDQVTLMTSGGIIIRTVVREIRQASRATKGVRVVSPGEGDAVVAMARISAAVEAKADAEAEAEAKRSLSPRAVVPTNGDASNGDSENGDGGDVEPVEATAP